MRLRLQAAVVVVILCAVTAAAVARGAATRPLAIDRASSRVSIAVGKAGAFSFIAGHTHEVSGPIGGVVDFDADDVARSQIRIEIEAAALKVSEKGEPPEDVPKVQRAMLSAQVLDVERFPTITFRSTSISVKTAAKPVVDLMVAGTLTLHGVSRPLTVPVHAEVTNAAVNAKGQFGVKQTDFGMKPVSVGGVVAVKDALTISFAITAHRK